jgi:hypothetical protein
MRPVQFPIIIGVTGHRDIHRAAVPNVVASVRQVLAEWRSHYGDALYLLTALADGADQLVAIVARRLRIPVIAVLPMARDTYHATIANQARLDRLLKKAEFVLELPDLSSTCAPNHHERQFEQLGMFLARQSHFLLALWDGEEEPTNRAGTAAVVRMRLLNDESPPMLRDSPLFLGAGSLFRMTDAGPLLRISTPRTGATVPNDTGACFLFDTRGPRRQLSWRQPRARSVPCNGSHARLDRATRRDLGQIAALNQILLARDPIRQTLARRQFDDLGLAAVPDAASYDATWLGWLQAGTDAAAQTHQTRLIGHFVPSRSWDHMWNKLRGARELGHNLPRPGAIFWLTFAVPVAVLSLETFAHLGGGLIAYLVYILILIGTYTFYRLRIADAALQNRFQDHRALAEALRVQLFWGLSTLRTATSDHYLGKQIGELGWIQFALRGPALWSVSLAQRLRTPDRAFVLKSWVNHQRRYFIRSARLHRGAARRSDRCGRFLLSLAILSSCVLLALEVGCAGIAYCGLECEGTIGSWVKRVLLVAVATFPVLGAFFTVSAQMRAYEAHAHSYRQMRWIFTRAGFLAERIETMATEPLRNTAFRHLAHELGREALAENAEWLVDHRRRPLESELAGGGRQEEPDDLSEASVDESA